MFGKKQEPHGIQCDVLTADKAVFLEFDGATAEVDDAGKLEFTPRGKIYINVGHIGGYYDHTILLFGNKIRVMDTVHEIALKVLEAGK